MPARARVHWIGVTTALAAVFAAPAGASAQAERATPLPGVAPAPPYGIGRAESDFRLDHPGGGPHFAPGASAAAPLRPGMRADGRSTTVCPMPVAAVGSDSADMPRWTADRTAPPMPVAPSGCVNPLRRP